VRDRLAGVDLMSVAWPSKPPQSWWIKIFAFGSAIRLLLAPAASSSAPSDIAMPTPIVAISGLDGDLAGAGELELHVIPVLFGQGRRLFEGLAAEQIELERTRILEGEGGVTQCTTRSRPPDEQARSDEVAGRGCAWAPAALNRPRE
jgi:hypothetical protein